MVLSLVYPRDLLVLVSCSGNRPSDPIASTVVLIIESLRGGTDFLRIFRVQHHIWNDLVPLKDGSLHGKSVLNTSARKCSSQQRSLVTGGNSVVMFPASDHVENSVIETSFGTLLNPLNHFRKTIATSLDCSIIQVCDYKRIAIACVIKVPLCIF